MSAHKYALAIIGGKIYPLPITKVETNGHIKAGDYLLATQGKYQHQYPNAYAVNNFPYHVSGYTDPNRIVFSNYVPVPGSPLEKIILDNKDIRELNIDNILPHANTNILNELYNNGVKVPLFFRVVDVPDQDKLRLIKWMIVHNSVPDANYVEQDEELISEIDAMLVPRIDDILPKNNNLYWHLIDKYKLVPSSNVVDSLLKGGDIGMIEGALEAKGVPSQQGVDYVVEHGSSELKKWLFGNLYYYQTK